MPSEVPPRLAALGLNADDWQRIRKSIEAVGPNGAPPALRDLSVPVAVAAVTYEPRYGKADVLGIVTRPDGLKVKLIAWRMSDHEEGLWRQRREALAARSPPGKL